MHASSLRACSTNLISIFARALEVSPSKSSDARFRASCMLQSRQFRVGRHCPRSIPSRLSQDAQSFGESHDLSLVLPTLDICPKGYIDEGGAVCETRTRTFAELRSLTGLNADDIRLLHDQRSSGRALIEPRGGRSLLVRLGSLQAVMLADRCVLFNAKNSVVEFVAKSILLPLAEGASMEEPSRGFEIDCLEAVLETTARRLRRRADCFGPVVERLCASVVSAPPEESLAQLVNVSRALVQMERHCMSIVSCLEEAVATDENVEEFLLSTRHDKVRRMLHCSGSLHQQLLNDKSCPELVESVKNMLESYEWNFNSIGDQLYFSQQAIETTQHSVRIMLEHKRTNLLALNVDLTIATLSIGVMAAAGGLFGMNVPLPGGVADSPTSFYHVCGGAALVSLGTYVACRMKTSNRPQKARMRQAHRAWQLAQRMPQLPDVLLKRLESHSVLQEIPLVEASVSLSEFSEIINTEITCSHVTEKEIKDIFTVIDHNYDGRLQIDDVADLMCVLSSSWAAAGDGPLN